MDSSSIFWIWEEKYINNNTPFFSSPNELLVDGETFGPPSDKTVKLVYTHICIFEMKNMHIYEQRVG